MILKLTIFYIYQNFLIYSRQNLFCWMYRWKKFILSEEATERYSAKFVFCTFGQKSWKIYVKKFIFNYYFKKNGFHESFFTLEFLIFCDSKHKLNPIKNCFVGKFSILVKLQTVGLKQRPVWKFFSSTLLQLMITDAFHRSFFKF